ncbi:MAG: hypothetical protein ACRD3W_11535, partial [Terriglobales bacterium]
PFNPWVLSHSQARFGQLDEAIEFIIGEQPHSPNNWALQYEALLSERYEQFPPPGEPDYKFLGGQLPILIMAPHATAYWREGEFQEAESFTGSMCAMIHRMSGAHALVSHYCCVADPLWYLETPMRRVFADIVKAGQIGMVVLLLGSSWQEAPGLQISCHGPAPQICQDYVTRLKNKLGALEPVSTEGFDHLVRPFVQFSSDELQVPTMMIKMHKRYRMPRLQPYLFTQLLGLINEFVSETGIELLRSHG